MSGRESDGQTRSIGSGLLFIFNRPVSPPISIPDRTPWTRACVQGVVMELPTLGAGPGFVSADACNLKASTSEVAHNCLMIGRCLVVKHEVERPLTQ